MNWENVVKKEAQVYQIPAKWLSIHYYEALNILFRFENSLRIFVYIILKNEYLEKWVTINISSETDENTSIGSVAKKRINQAQNFGYLGYEVSCPIMHLTSGELVELITSEGYWKLFKPYFRGSKEIMRNKFLEIGTIRNSLAHFRPIREDDVSLIKQNTKHCLIGIEECLTHLFQTFQVVPTNTEEEWYKKIRPLCSDPTKINIFQSTNEDWVKIQIIFYPRVLNKSQMTPRRIRFRILNLRSPEIVSVFPNIAKYLTYLSEHIPSFGIDENLNPNFAKNINLVFSRKILQGHAAEIAEELGTLILTITQETELIKQDNLARGKLIESISETAILRDVSDRTSWFTLGNSRCPNKPQDPPEYWGEIDFPAYDFISGTPIYPWMLSSISGGEIPF